MKHSQCVLDVATLILARIRLSVVANRCYLQLGVAGSCRQTFQIERWLSFNSIS